MTHDQLAIIWFVLIAVLWCGYFVLEGFDFGVGILLPFIGKNEAERRTIVSTLGPVWDGNEVWLLTAGGATFAAFSLWYATLFSGFYLALLLILVALIVRGVAFEFRSKRGTTAAPNWRRNWDWAIVFGSFLPALLWGVAFANIVAGVPLELQNGNSEFTGNLFTLLNPYALLGGLVTLGLFTTHGAIFLALKTEGDIRTRANKLAGQIGLVTAVLAVAFGLWTQLAHSNNTVASVVVLVLVVLAWVGALAANRLGREGWAFIASAATMVFVVAFLFVCLPERDAELHERGRDAHGPERGELAVHPHDHDLGRGDPDAGRAGLPVVDLLGVPQAALPQPDPAPGGGVARPAARGVGVTAGTTHHVT